MNTKRLNWKNFIWIIFEILISTFIYYLIQWILENTEFPFTDDLFLGVFILLFTLGIIYGFAIFGFIKVDEFLTKEKLNLKKGILYLIIGATISIVAMNLFVELNLIRSDFPLSLFILIVMSVTVLGFNYGLRIKKTMPNTG